MRKEVIKLLLVLAALVLISAFSSDCFAISKVKNLSAEANETKIAIENAKLDIEEMIEAGFNVSRVNDTIIEAEQLYEAQLALEEKTGKANYYTILEKIKTVSEVKKLAFLVFDELKALETSMNEKIAITLDANFSEATALFEQAKKEFYDERYEQCPELIEKAYKKATEAEAAASRLRAFYRATTATIGNFFKRNWKIIVSAAVIILVAYLILRNRFTILKIKRKIKKLELEKQVLYDLVKKAQKEYFELGKLSETNYRVKTKKFAELIRDIDRQIPLLKEELVKRKMKEKEKITKPMPKVPKPRKTTSKGIKKVKK